MYTSINVVTVARNNINYANMHRQIIFTFSSLNVRYVNILILTDNNTYSCFGIYNPVDILHTSALTDALTFKTNE